MSEWVVGLAFLSVGCHVATTLFDSGANWLCWLCVQVFDGLLKAGTPLCFVKDVGGTRTVVPIGVVVSIERNNENVDRVRCLVAACVALRCDVRWAALRCIVAWRWFVWWFRSSQQRRCAAADEEDCESEAFRRT